MKVDVFLSYAEEDRPLAAQLAALLEGHGWSLWWDRKIPPGKTWRQTIEEAIGSMDCMVVLWSAHSIESPWVQEEAEEGLARGRLLPVLIDDVRPPMGFRSIQACDLRQRPGELASAPGYEVLLAAIEARVGASASGPATDSAGPLPRNPSALPTQPAPSDRKSGRRGAWLVGAAATVVAAGLVYLALPKPSLREPVVPASQSTAAGESAAAEPATASGTPSTTGGSSSSTDGDAVSTPGLTASTAAAAAAQSAPASPTAARAAPARPARLSAYCQAIRDRRDIGDPVRLSELKECRL